MSLASIWGLSGDMTNDQCPQRAVWEGREEEDRRWREIVGERKEEAERMEICRAYKGRWAVGIWRWVSVYTYKFELHRFHAASHFCFFVHQ